MDEQPGQENSDAGFTLVETLIAIVISIALAAALSSVVLGAIALVNKIHAQSVQQATVADALSDFTSSATSSIRVIAASPTSLQYVYQSGDTCKVATYQLVPDKTSTTSTLLLQRATSQLKVDAGATCAQVNNTAALTGYGKGIYTTVLSQLGPGSTFNFRTVTGAPAVLPGFPGFSASSATPLCKVGTVDLSLQTTRRTSSNDWDTQTFAAAFRTNLTGVTC